MKDMLKRFVREEEGQDLIEYVLLAALIAVAAIVGMNAVATAVNNKFTSVGTTITGAGS